MTSTLTPEILHALRTIRDGSPPPPASERVMVPSWAVQAMNDLVPGSTWRLTAAGAAVVALADERDELRLTLAAEQGRPEGAPSEGWKPNYQTGQFPSYQWRKTAKNGERVTVDYFPVERRWEWCFMNRPNRENFPYVRERFRNTARDAMRTVDKALSGEG